MEENDLSYKIRGAIFKVTIILDLAYWNQFMKQHLFMN
jgi:hypothetical protein